jgi:hypothetical protein
MEILMETRTNASQEDRTENSVVFQISFFTFVQLLSP